MSMQAGIELFSQQKNGCVVYVEKEGFPKNFVIMQSFYGNASGASKPPENKLFLAGERIGTATGEAMIIAGKEYYRLKTTVEERSTSGFLGMGAGIYTPFDLEVWVLSSDVTFDKQQADELLNFRENAKQITKQQNTQKLLEVLQEPSTLEPSETPPKGIPNFTQLILIVMAFIVLLISAILIWKSKKVKKLPAQLSGLKHQLYGIFQQRYSKHQR